MPATKASCRKLISSALPSGSSSPKTAFAVCSVKYTPLGSDNGSLSFPLIMWGRKTPKKPLSVSIALRKTASESSTSISALRSLTPYPPILVAAGNSYSKT